MHGVRRSLATSEVDFHGRVKCYFFFCDPPTVPSSMSPMSLSLSFSSIPRSSVPSSDEFSWVVSLHHVVHRAASLVGCGPLPSFVLGIFYKMGYFFHPWCFQLAQSQCFSKHYSIRIFENHQSSNQPINHPYSIVFSPEGITRFMIGRKGLANMARFKL